jgi:hypothetical protein
MQKHNFTIRYSAGQCGVYIGLAVCEGYNDGTLAGLAKLSLIPVCVPLIP